MSQNYKRVKLENAGLRKFLGIPNAFLQGVRCGK